MTKTRMSKETPDLRADASGLRFAIVVARFNAEITEKLRLGAEQALEKAETKDVFHVPGAFELALAAKQLAESRRYDAIVALGAVVRGDTPHFDYVAQGAAQGIMQAMLETGTPISFGVLTTDDREQAEARAGGAHGNKGHDAAMTAVDMVRLAQRIKGA
jgi:6,7-dimethyl-8-ribityllumazine synthase